MWVVPRLSCCAADAADPPPDYRRLARPRDAAALAVLVAISTLALYRIPAIHLPLWFGYLGAGGALVWVDFKTTWLPKQLHWLAVAQLMAGLLVVAFLDPPTALAAVAGGVTTTALLWLVWRFSRTFGFGDVRLGILVGAAAGSLGLRGWGMGLFAGTAVGALWAIVHVLRQRTGPFPYGPSLWLGPLLAALVSR